MIWKSDFCNEYGNCDSKKNKSEKQEELKIQCEIYKNIDTIKIKTPDGKDITGEYSHIAEALREERLPEFSFYAEIIKQNKASKNQFLEDQDYCHDEQEIVFVIDIISLNGSSLNKLNINQKMILLQRSLKDDKRLKFKIKEQKND